MGGLRVAGIQLSGVERGNDYMAVHVPVHFQVVCEDSDQGETAAVQGRVTWVLDSWCATSAAGVSI